MIKIIQLPTQTISYEVACKITAYADTKQFKTLIGKALRIKPETIEYMKLLGLDFEGWAQYIIYVSKGVFKDLKDYRISVRYNTTSDEAQEVRK